VIFLYNKLFINNSTIKTNHFLSHNSSSPPPLIGLPKENKSAFAQPGEATQLPFMTLVANNEQNPIGLAKFNLMCAKGLPYSEGINVDECLDLLNKMAEQVKSETARHFYKYRKNPQDYYNSEAYFRMLVLITVLQQDFQIKYNPKLIDLSYDENKLKEPFTPDSRDVFLHGLLTGKRQGSCASMPVLYLIVGRLLNYPLKLAAAKAHLFLRWEDNKERINLEASGMGLGIKNDDYYRNFPFKITPTEEKFKFYLKSMDINEEMSVFLENRAGVLMANGQLLAARGLYGDILRIVPNHPHASAYIKDLDSKISGFRIHGPKRGTAAADLLPPDYYPSHTVPNDKPGQPPITLIERLPQYSRKEEQTSNQFRPLPVYDGVQNQFYKKPLVPTVTPHDSFQFSNKRPNPNNNGSTPAWQNFNRD
jgi:hypothetical protein